MTLKPVGDAKPNTFAFETQALVSPTGFREYDARWRFGHPASDKAPELNLLGVQALGMGLATLIRRLGVGPEIVIGHDFRSYSMGIKLALASGGKTRLSTSMDSMVLDAVLIALASGSLLGIATG